MKQRRRSGGLGMIIMIVAVVILIIIVGRKIITLKRSVDAEKAELDRINREIYAAEEEKLDIENEIRYRETDEYIEDQAKELGLRYPDEVIIVPKDD